jgi:hypothetical protein
MKNTARHPDFSTPDTEAATRTLPALHATNVALALAAGGVGCAILGWESSQVFFSCLAAGGACIMMGMLLGMQFRVKKIVEHRSVTIGRVVLALLVFAILSIFGLRDLREFFQPLVEGRSVSPSQFRSGAHGFCASCIGVLATGLTLGLPRDETSSVESAADSNASLNRPG